uniref:ATP synthase subunit a n=1 Tax=Mastigoproctus giganteus TaxID=58767 RepID=Q535E7_MASGI|nr:ATP synthase F0 subunit 6 [Mastigoproctus giganteus]
MILMNLFSIFEPSSFLNIPLMWIILILPMIFIPTTFWFKFSPANQLTYTIFYQLNSEFNQIMTSFKHKGTTLIFSIMFLMILTYNFIGLFPYIFTSTAHLVVTLSLALPFWLTFMFFGWVKNTNLMFSHLVPIGTPQALSPFMVCIETISNIIRPITLSVRLAANMIAGHLILSLMSMVFSPILMKTYFVLPMISPILILESAVAIIQAFVFSMLVTLYSTEIH